MHQEEYEVSLRSRKYQQEEGYPKDVFIESLFVCNCKALNLECRHLSYKVGIIPVRCADHNVFKSLFVINLKELTALNLLAVCGRFYELSYL